MKFFKPIVLIITLLTAGFVGCKEDTNNEIKPVQTIVIAGQYDSTFIYHEFVPPLEMNVVWDSIRLYGSAVDSIDLDAIGSFELFFDLAILNYDSIHLLNGLSQIFPHFRMKSRNGIYLTMERETYGVGLGQTAFADYVKMFSIGDSITIQNLWFYDEARSLPLWQTNHDGGLTPPFGDWYNIHDTRFIGILLKYNQIGWIKIDATINDNPKIVSFAYQK
ncbi:MAG: hypothetical protein Q8T08_02365 [Ignavibacteria bacterium]|nr:hypothetical protein [Ignavibacteria bacterium]